MNASLPIKFKTSFANIQRKVAIQKSNQRHIPLENWISIDLLQFSDDEKFIGIIIESIETLYPHWIVVSLEEQDDDGVIVGHSKVDVKIPMSEKSSFEKLINKIL